jgi:hypothetical protein
MIGQAQMEPLAYANHFGERLFCRANATLTLSVISVLSPTHARRMDCLFFHVHSLHGLVAQFHLWNLELVTTPACVLRSGRPCDVFR